MKQSLLLYLTILAVLSSIFYLYVLLSKLILKNRYAKTTKKLRDSIALVSISWWMLIIFHWQKMRMHKIILILEVQRK
jgi:hypothetical protein